MLCIEGDRSTIGSFYANLSPLSCGKKNNIRYCSKKKLFISLS